MATSDGDSSAGERRHDFGLDQVPLGVQPWGKAPMVYGDNTIPLRQLSDRVGLLDAMTTTGTSCSPWRRPIHCGAWVSG